MLNNLRNGCKIGALIAALVLPSLAHAEHEGIHWGRDFDHGRDWKHRDPVISTVPEANPGIVLIPVMGAIFLVSSIRLLRTRKA